MRPILPPLNLATDLRGVVLDSHTMIVNVQFNCSHFLSSFTIHFLMQKAILSVISNMNY